MKRKWAIVKIATNSQKVVFLLYTEEGRKKRDFVWDNVVKYNYN